MRLRVNVSRQNMLKTLILATVLALLLAACERPLQNVTDDGYPPPTEIVPTEVLPTVVAPEDTATEVAPPTEPAPAETPESTDESPRTDDGVEDGAEATAEATEEPMPEATAEATPEPTAEATPEPTVEATATMDAESGAERAHVVQPGENLYRIGLQYGISWTVLAEYNNITNPNSLVVGQQLRIPPVEGQGPAATPAPQVTHVVQAGETLFIISQQYGVAWPDIAAANNLTAPYTIHVGQSLVIPGG